MPNQHYTPRPTFIALNESIGTPTHSPLDSQLT